MRLRGRADWVFLTIIAATGLLKLSTLRSEPVLSDDLLVSRIKGAMTEAGLAAAVRPDPPLGSVVTAKAGNCRIWARNFEPYGNSLSYYQEQAAGVGPLTFVYKNVLYSRAPKLEPLLSFYLSRELARARLPASRRPIVAVAASPGCDLHAIAWDRVSEVPW